MLTVQHLIGLPSLPQTPFGIRKWLKANCIPLADDGKRFTFALSDLPSEVQRALLEREAEREGLELGERDEDAHARFAEATPKMQAKAERLAQIARFIVARRGLGIPNREIFEAARARFGAEDTSDRSCYRILKDIEGVAVVNFAPALLDAYNMDGRPCGPNWDDAWYFALAEIKAAGPEWPLDAAYDKIVASAPEMGWHVPGRSTFNARWQALSEVERFSASAIALLSSAAPLKNSQRGLPFMYSRIATLLPMPAAPQIKAIRKPVMFCMCCNDRWISRAVSVITKSAALPVTPSLLASVTTSAMVFSVLRAGFTCVEWHWGARQRLPCRLLGPRFHSRMPTVHIGDVFSGHRVSFRSGLGLQSAVKLRLNDR